MQPILARSTSGGHERAAPDTGLEAFDDALWRLVRVIQFRDRDRICCAGLTVSQGHALQLIAQAPGMRLIDLAARLRMNKSTATRVTAALVRLGYVKRSRDPSDARASLLACTPKGKRAHGDLRRLLASEHETLVKELSTSERASVTRVLRELADLLERREQAPSALAEDCGVEEPS